MPRRHVRKERLTDPRAGSKRENQHGSDVVYIDEINGENEYSANTKSLKKARRYLILSFLTVIVAISVFALSNMMHDASINSDYVSCWTHEQEIEQGALSYVKSNRLSSYPAYIEDVETLEGLRVYKCPSGGTYSWNPITGEYTCSVHGHYDPRFNAPDIESGNTTYQEIEE